MIPKAGKEIALRTDRTVSLIGDNFDTNIIPRDMRIDHQKTSLHLFHSCATVGRVETLHLDDLNPSGDLPNLPISAFLPSQADCATIRDNYVILAARVITTHFASFSSLRSCVPDHIEHQFSDEMKQKSVTVRTNVYSTLLCLLHCFRCVCTVCVCVCVRACVRACTLCPN